MMCLLWKLIWAFHSSKRLEILFMLRDNIMKVITCTNRDCIAFFITRTAPVWNKIFHPLNIVHIPGPNLEPIWRWTMSEESMTRNWTMRKKKNNWFFFLHRMSFRSHELWKWGIISEVGQRTRLMKKKDWWLPALEKIFSNNFYWWTFSIGQKKDHFWLKLNIVDHLKEVKSQRGLLSEREGETF